MPRSRLLTPLTLFCLLPSAIALRAAETPPPYLDQAQPVAARVANLLPRLTLEEKISLVHGKDNWTSGGVPRLGLPPLWMDDGPMGVREEGNGSYNLTGGSDDAATALPANLGLAATWNPQLAFDYGAVIGSEAYRRGKNIMLGPALNIQRTPLCGRNFEYMGEDPFLTSRIAVGYIRGQASEGISGTAKHFAANNQETQRNTVDARVDERTLREIYLPAFKAAVQEGGVLSVMGSYNFLNGQHACESDFLLNQVLKKEWGFQGLVESDWGGVHDTKEAVFNGMDIEMPGRGNAGAQNYLATAYLTGLQDGTYPVATLDAKVARILTVMARLGLLDGTARRTPAPLDADHPLSTAEHQAVARRIEEEAIVLLKNGASLLPLDATALKTVAVIGDNAQIKFAHSGGSALIKAPYEITALDGIRRRVGPGVNVTFARGYIAPTGGGGRGRRGTPPPPAADPAALVTEAVDAAKAADLVIYVGGLTHDGGYDSEGNDRPDLKLPAGQDELLRQVLAANPKTVVVLLGGGAVEMPWIDQASTLLYGWYPGLEGGNALARVLFGDVNPSGKLPCTFPKQLADTPTAAGGPEAYPGVRNPALPPAPAGGAGTRGGGGNPLVPQSIETYSEKLLVGYRWYDTKKIEPLFPFGFGLSYTNFAYSNVHLVSRDTAPGGQEVIVQFDLTNTGSREGSEIAQVYVRQAKSTLERPEKELKGFVKVALKPGEKQTMSVRLDHDSFAYFDPAQSGWVAEAGDFQIIVAASSRDPRLQTVYHLAQTSVTK